MRSFLWSSILLLVAGVAPVQAASPKLDAVLPRGGQRGTEVVVSLRGERLGDARGVVFTERGLNVVDFNVVNEQRVDATVSIATDCRPGPHGLLVRTATGLSNLRTFSVGALPIVEEVEPNNEAATAQPLALDHTVHGVAANEDVDYFALTLDEGASVTAEVEGLRLGDVLFDPSVTVFDDRGFEVASSDDAALLRQDAVVSFVAPSAGRYLLMVRESAYAGSNRCHYRLHVGRFPRPLGLLPAGAPAGATVTAQCVGDTAPRETVLAWPPAASAAVTGGWIADGVVGVFVEDDRGVAPSPNYVRVNDLPNAIEVEPNDEPKTATASEAPGAFNGVIDRAGDRDWFRFSARQGETLQVEVFARRLRSPLDPVINVRKVGGGNIKGNDDAEGPDSRLRFDVPEDGEYLVQVRDHLGRGGGAFVYRVEVGPVVPALRVSGPRTPTGVAVPRGGRAAIMLSLQRSDVGGVAVVECLELPTGVSAVVAPVAGAVDRIPVVLAAAPDAPDGHGLVDVRATLAENATPVSGSYRQDVELALGRNNTVFWAHTIERLPVVVVDPTPFAIDVASPPGPLVRNGSLNLVVRARRDEGFDGRIQLRVPFTPPGIGAASNVVIEPGQSEASIVVNANGGAALGSWSVVVTAESEATGGGHHQVASDLVPLHVVEPFVAFKGQAVSVEQGASVVMPIDVTRHRADAGPATVELRGLPHQVTAVPVELPEDAGVIQFELVTGADSPPGLHKNVFCLARFEQGGAPVVHRLPAGHVRIDRPLPAPKAAPPPPPPPATPSENTAAPARLTRLEKLRQEDALRREQLRQAARSGDAAGGAP